MPSPITVDKPKSEILTCNLDALLKNCDKFHLIIQFLACLHYTNIHKDVSCSQIAMNKIFWRQVHHPTSNLSSPKQFIELILGLFILVTKRHLRWRRFLEKYFDPPWTLQLNCCSSGSLCWHLQWTESHKPLGDETTKISATLGKWIPDYL